MEVRWSIGRASATEWFEVTGKPVAVQQDASDWQASDCSFALPCNKRSGPPFLLQSSLACGPNSLSFWLPPALRKNIYKKHRYIRNARDQRGVEREIGATTRHIAKKPAGRVERESK